MSQPWAGQVPQSQKAFVAELRLTPSIRLLETENHIWLQGEDLEEQLRAQLLRIPDILLFHVEVDRQLIPLGATVPNGYLPSGDWILIRNWCSVRLPVAAYSGETHPTVLITIVRSAECQEANTLVADFADWRRFVETAPSIRLRNLKFAVHESGKTMIVGSPLPPIPGLFLYAEQGIAVESGWRVEPRVEPQILAHSLKLGGNDIAWIQRTGEVEVVLANDFCPATRSAVRRTRLAHAAT